MARNQLSVFRIFDIVIGEYVLKTCIGNSIDTLAGALSFVPILFYILFIFLFANRFYFHALPRMIGIISKYVLLALIPITIATSELGSFLGIRYRE